MSRIVFAAAGVVLLGLGQPASAMMCGGGAAQAQSTGNTVTSGMMCGSAQAADDPMAEKPAQQSRQATGMCPCCRNMAMMRGGMRGGAGGGMQHHDMPGMEMPKN